MIDTVVLTLSQNMFTILDHEKFTPSTKGLYDATSGYYRMGGRANVKCYQNPTSKELKQGIYKPRLTVTKRFNRERNFEITMKIEFSAPKLIFGNNFDELTDANFTEIIGKLKTVLKEMGVFVFESKLEKAPVSSIHFSKNIPLTDFTTPYTYLEQLAKVNINQRLDTNQTDYRNEGHSFKYRANSFEIAFYDKLKDLRQAKTSEKRAEESDNQIQLNLFDLLSQNKPFEVLRMEVRLNKRQKIKQILKKIGINTEVIFTNLFSQEMSKLVLSHYLEEIEKNYPPLLAYQYETPKSLFTSLLTANPKITLSTALKMMGLRVLLNEVGVREFRQVTKRYGNYNWYSLNKEMKKLEKTGNSSVFTTLKKEINLFKPLKLVDFEAKMLNNDKNE